MAIPQSDWQRPAGSSPTTWLATMKNSLSSNNLNVEMSPSWHWTDHSGGYWQQVELRTELMQAEQ